MSSADQISRYRITLGCHLDGRWSRWLEGVTITNLSSGEAVLATPPIDQSALHGLLKQTRDLNIILVSVEKLAASSSGS